MLALFDGLQEETLFRGLFLERFILLFCAVVANVLQVTVFSFGRFGVSNTPAYPIALAVPAIEHGALDVVSYRRFLASVAA
jgi:membrane protease YdiL (CAAX protease family)